MDSIERRTACAGARMVWRLFRQTLALLIALVPALAVAQDASPPTVPTGLTATPVTSSRIDLAWSASTDNVGVTGYRLERCTGATCTNFTQIATPTTTSFSNTGRAASTTYRYRVRAADAAGNLSGYSAIVSATTPAADTTAPSTPTGLTGVAVSSTQINLSWNASTDNVGVTSYRIFRCQGTTCTTFTQVGTSATTSFSNTGLAAGTAYRYRVRAVDAAGNLSTNSSIVTVTTPAADTTAPSAPGSFSAAAASSTQINLSWTAATDNVGVTGYRVERCQGAGCTTFAQIAAPTTTSFSDTALTASTTYQYRVRAVDAAGNLGPYSTTAAATTAAPPDTNAPTTPATLSATPGGSTTITVSWSASTDNVAVTGYLLERCQGAGCTTFSQIATPTGTSLNDTGLTASTTYQYRVRARDAAGNQSGYSPVGAATTAPPPDTTAPTAPTALIGTAAGATLVSLTWTAATDNVGVTGYLVERCQGAGCTGFVQIATPTATSFSDAGLTEAITYLYRVRAADAAGNLGPYSTVASVTTADITAPAAPGALTATASSSTRIDLAWPAATDNVAVTGYQLERCQGAGCTTFTQIAAPTGATFSDTSLAASTDYQYRVRAVDAAGNLSAFSPTGAATTPAPPDSTPPTISNGQPSGALPVGTVDANLTVVTSEDATCRFSAVAGTAFSAMTNTFTNTGGTAHSSLMTGLQPGQSVIRYVRCRDVAGNASTADYPISFTVATGAAMTWRYEYDAIGNLTKVTDPRGQATDYQYDALSRRNLIRQPPPETGSPQPTIGLAYDGRDQLRTVTDPRNLTTTYTTDGLGNTATQASPDTGATEQTFNEAGLVLTRRDARGVVATYGYDAGNRLTAIAYAGPGVTPLTDTWTYDVGANAIGKLSSVSYAGGSTAWTYDGHGRMNTQTQTVGAVALTLQKTYDEFGRLQTVTYPSGRVLTYGYANGQLASVSLDGSAIASGIGYAPFGAVTNWTWGNGSTYSRSHDSFGRLTTYPIGPDTRLISYDDSGRISQMTHLPIAGIDETFGYDNLDRLTQAITGITARSYAYDATGNRTQASAGSGTDVYTTSPTSNRLQAVAGSSPRSFSYDAMGNVTGDGNFVATYDARGRLATIRWGAAATTTYVYDALGRRLRKSGGPAGTVHYAYDEDGKLLGEYDAAGQPVQETVWLGDLPLAVLSQGQTFYVHADHLGTPRAVIDTQNRLRWRWISEAFGMLPPENNPSGLGNFTLNLRFPGQVFDSESNLHYNFFRDYDPNSGRYVQSDPIGLEGGINTYGYVEANPVSRVDPLGLKGVGDILWLDNVAKCVLSSSAVAKHARECQKECPDDLRGQAEFIEKYSSSGQLDAALIACMCEKAGPRACGDAVAKCTKAAAGKVKPSR